MLNTHRPDAYRLRPCAFEPVASDDGGAKANTLRLAFRRFRPPIAAEITVKSGLPVRIRSLLISGAVIQAAGPWRTSGEWWAESSWDRDEWDVVVEEEGIYRVYLSANRWFIDGSYD
jgi:protein ImuB